MNCHNVTCGIWRLLVDFWLSTKQLPHSIISFYIIFRSWHIPNITKKPISSWNINIICLSWFWKCKCKIMHHFVVMHEILKMTQNHADSVVISIPWSTIPIYVCDHTLVITVPADVLALIGDWNVRHVLSNFSGCQWFNSNFVYKMKSFRKFKCTEDILRIDIFLHFCLMNTLFNIITTPSIIEKIPSTVH